MDSLDFMGEYDASIVNALFAPPPQSPSLSLHSSSPPECDDIDGVFHDVESSMPAGVVRLRVGCEAFDVPTSTLSPPNYKMVLRDSPL